MSEYRQSHRQRWRFPILISIAYDWLLWTFVLVLIVVQLVSLVTKTQPTNDHYVFGQSPLHGVYNIPGENDEPYTDRTIACILRGRTYKAIQVSTALASSTDAVITNTDGTTVHGYRLLARDSLKMTTDVLDFWSNVCQNVLTPLLENVLGSCSALGYNVTTDHLRVLNGLTTQTTHSLPRTLPVLITIVADNAKTCRLTVPSWDGSACVFRFDDVSLNAGASGIWMFGVNRTVREHMTEKWLGVHDGQWRNGWLERPNSQKRWYSDVVATKPDDALGILRRFFDVKTGKEMDCQKNPSSCEHRPYHFCWGNAICVVFQFAYFISVAIADGSRNGLFIFDGVLKRSVKSIVSVATVIADISILWLLLQWLVALVVVHRTYTTPTGHWMTRSIRTTGLGCVSCSSVFEWLPILLLPRLQQSLAAFFTAGIFFEGDQLSFSESWITIYPGIIQTVLFYFSLLNLLAKLMRRRITDVFFGPTLLFFCILHRIRNTLTTSGWYGASGRVTPAITTIEVESLTIWDCFITDATLRLGGNVTSLFLVKMIVLGLNLVPLCFGCFVSHPPNRTTASQVEKLVGLRAHKSTGLCSKVGSHGCTSVLISSEVIRLGYVVIGDTFLISIQDWILLVVSSHIMSLISCEHTIHVLVIPISIIWAADEPCSTRGPTFVLNGKPRYMCTDDPVFQAIQIRKISVLPAQ